jgi:hypothetical protein
MPEQLTNSEAVGYSFGYVDTRTPSPLPFAALIPYTIQALDIEYKAPVCQCISDLSDVSGGGGITIAI